MTTLSPFDWSQIPLRMTEGIGAYFAIVKLYGWVAHKGARFWAMPDQIEKLAKQASDIVRADIAAVSDRVYLLDGGNKLIQQALEVPFIELNREGLADFVSVHAAHLLGRERDDCLGNNWWSSVYPTRAASHHHREEIRERWKQALAEGGTFEEDVRLLSNGPGAGAITMRIIPIRPPKGGGVLGWKVLFPRQLSVLEPDAPPQPIRRIS